jgi:Putative arginyl-tRNA:protein arginylyltransferase
MLENTPFFINEEFHVRQALPGLMDRLWASGWRHFGTHFFRYSIGIHEFDIRVVIPLRIRLADFAFSKSQRRVLRKNANLETAIRPVAITDEKELLFDRHKQRFKSGIPGNIYDFISANSPCETLEVSARLGDRVIAVSFLDVGDISVSSVYAMFEPAEYSRSLGIFTLLKEIEFAMDNGKEFLYLGYCYEGKSFYDYKKRFRATEIYNWQGKWESSEFKL